MFFLFILISLLNCNARKCKMFPEYLREAGYYTSNKSKEDYNLVKSGNEWDDSSKTASWKNRNLGQAFFHKDSIGIYQAHLKLTLYLLFILLISSLKILAISMDMTAFFAST